MATQTLTIGDKDLNVAELPESIQTAVRFYDISLERMKEAESEYIIASSASKFILNDVTRLVGEYLSAPAEASAEAETEEVGQEEAAQEA